MKITKANKLSLLLYEENSSPKYFNVSKTLLRFIFVIMPAISVLAILSVFFLLVYIKGNHLYSVAKTPQIVDKLKEESVLLLKQIQELKQENKSMEDKLANLSVPTTDAYTPLKIFNSVPAQSVSSEQKNFSINEMKISAEDNKININFLLTNITEDGRKLSGFIILVMSDYSDIHFYPSTIITQDSFEVKYNTGEPFAVEKLRPVSASFPTISDAKNFIFKVLIYSRQGEILLDKNITHKL